MTDPHGTQGHPSAEEPTPKAAGTWPLVVGLLAVVLIVLISSVSKENEVVGSAASSTTTAAPGTTTTRWTPTTTTPTTTLAPPEPPKVYKGKGDDVITLDRKPGPGIAIFDCPKCTSNTILDSDGADGLLVNRIGPYGGKVWFDLRANSRTSTMTIPGKGSWTLTAGEFDLASKHYGAVSGKGDDVLLLMGSSSAATVTNTGKSNFVVYGAPIGGTQIHLVINEIGGYEGTVPLRTPALVLLSSSVRSGERPQLVAKEGAPVVFHGSGDNRVALVKEPGVGVVRFDCPQCTGNTVLSSDGPEGLLVNEIGPYCGKRWFDVRSGARTTELAVTATGDWTLTVGGTDLAAGGRGRGAVPDPAVQLGGADELRRGQLRGQRRGAGHQPDEPAGQPDRGVRGHRRAQRPRAAPGALHGALEHRDELRPAQETWAGLSGLLW